MSRISTHILDLMRGRPADDVSVRLEQQQASGTWCALGSCRTDRDGRCGQLLPTDDLPAGVYRLSFDTAAYFEAQKIAGLYPVIEITFQVLSGELNFHIPLLLTANGYTTYRGS